MKILNGNSKNFDKNLDSLLLQRKKKVQSNSVSVSSIIKDVRKNGDKALVKYEKRFNKNTIIVPSQKQIANSIKSLDKKVKKAIDIAFNRIYKFHSLQKFKNISYVDNYKNKLEYKYLPLESVAIYVPGSTASYPSSVLMNAIPAKVAGVSELIMVVPTPDGEVNDLVLAAAAISGVDRIFAIGGAQAVAALAYGTESIPQVDKIVGPGNIYVATAKGMVFGAVGIDMIAGPSEILVVCDGQTDPEWVAMDLFSQAEHDEDAQSILISQDSMFLQEVEAAIQRLLPTMERAGIIETSLSDRAALIQVKDLDEAVDVVNFIAPEHLELSVEDPMTMAKKVKHAGAIFMGRYTAEALGDYCAGPNHVLPTSRTARFSSPLGVYDFQKRSSLIQVSEQGAQTMGRLASVLARGEGLTAHARSAEFRLKDLL